MPKKSSSELGHAKIVINLLELISRCIGYGALFNPARSELQINNLQVMYQEALSILRTLAECEVKDQQATNDRKAAFKKLRPLVTRVINGMVAYGVSAKSIADARALQRRMNGLRTNKKNNSEDLPNVPTTIDNTEDVAAIATDLSSTRTISVSRQSYELVLEFFSKLLLLIQREPNYQPNEPDLQLSSLQAFEQELRYLQEMVINSETALENARIMRNTILYDDINGVVTRGKQVKSYVKAVFGATSQQYRQIAKLSFRKKK